jgi:hypothetical protein
VIFPAEGPLYQRVTGVLRGLTGEPGGWLSETDRRLTGGDKVQSLIEAWRRYAEQCALRNGCLLNKPRPTGRATEAQPSLRFSEKSA